jgi:outer membrane protein OmpA-like peptidoglycan-associated protein
MVNKKIKRVKDWKFSVFSAEDKLLKTFKGNGNIPSYLVWDGRDSNGGYVDNLKSCKYVLDLNGIDGKKSKIREKEIIRDPFVIASKTKKLNLAKKVYFEQNSADIHPAMEKRMILIANEIRRNKNVQVYIQGHSSGEGDRKQNIALSQERAKTVLRYLVEKYNISPLSVTTVGYGADIPMSTDNTEASRRLDRRVEVIIMGEKSVK